MKPTRITHPADMFYKHMNSFLFIVPSPTGRLAEYSVTTEYGMKGWLFIGHCLTDGEEHRSLIGYFSGSLDEGYDFLRNLKRWGFSVAEVSLDVPGASGKQQGTGEYPQEELVRVLDSRSFSRMTDALITASVHKTTREAREILQSMLVAAKSPVKVPTLLGRIVRLPRWVQSGIRFGTELIAMSFGFAAVVTPFLQIGVVWQRLVLALILGWTSAIMYSWLTETDRD